MFIRILTTYTIQEDDGNEITYQAKTSNLVSNGDMNNLLDIHEEKVSSIERKILKEYVQQNIQK